MEQAGSYNLHLCRLGDKSFQSRLRGLRNDAATERTWRFAGNFLSDDAVDILVDHVTATGFESCVEVIDLSTNKITAEKLATLVGLCERCLRSFRLLILVNNPCASVDGKDYFRSSLRTSPLTFRKLVWFPPTWLAGRAYVELLDIGTRFSAVAEQVSDFVLSCWLGDPYCRETAWAFPLDSEEIFQSPLVQVPQAVRKKWAEMISECQQKAGTKASLGQRLFWAVCQHFAVCDVPLFFVIEVAQRFVTGRSLPRSLDAAHEWALLARQTGQYSAVQFYDDFAEYEGEADDCIEQLREPLIPLLPDGSTEDALIRTVRDSPIRPDVNKVLKEEPIPTMDDENLHKRYMNYRWPEDYESFLLRIVNPRQKSLWHTIPIKDVELIVQAMARASRDKDIAALKTPLKMLMRLETENSESLQLEGIAKAIWSELVRHATEITTKQ